MNCIKLWLASRSLRGLGSLGWLRLKLAWSSQATVLSLINRIVDLFWRRSLFRPLKHWSPLRLVGTLLYLFDLSLLYLITVKLSSLCLNHRYQKVFSFFLISEPFKQVFLMQSLWLRTSCFIKYWPWHWLFLLRHLLLLCSFVARRLEDGLQCTKVANPIKRRLANLNFSLHLVLTITAGNSHSSEWKFSFFLTLFAIQIV